MARALEVLGERWTLLVVRELMCGSTGYNEIRRGIPAIPRDTLTKRLRTLERAEIATKRDGGSTKSSYHLTPAGEALGPLMVKLAAWSLKWDNRGLLPEHLDPNVLLWDIHRRINPEAAPDGRVTIEFTLSDRPASDRQMWLILTDGDPELCRTDGDYDIDVYVTTSTETLASWWLGELDWSAAEESGAAQIQAYMVFLEPSLAGSSAMHWRPPNQSQSDHMTLATAQGLGRLAVGRKLSAESASSMVNSQTLRLPPLSLFESMT